MEPQSATVAPQMDFRALPKIELHAHLSGSISRECLHEVWLQKVARGETELQDPLVEMPVGKHDYDLEEFFPLFSKYIYNLITDTSSLRYTTRSVLQSFAADGVVYLELRTTPRAIPTANITKDLYISTILEVLHDFNTSSLMTTNLIISVDRRNTPEQAQEALDIALKYKDQGVVGLDLCGDPSKGDISIFTPVFTQAKEEGLGVTVHFAEIPTEDGKGELETLLSWKPDRLGHVIHVPEHLKREILERGIGVELCLSCNVLAKMMEHGTEGFGDHHFGWWWGEGEGEGIAVSTDDVGVFGSTLSNEYALIAQHFKLDKNEICKLARGAVNLIFGGAEERERLRGVMW